MTIAPRGAAIRGDDYQHVIGLFNAGRVLTEPSWESVSVEDADGGAFDDVVLRATAASGLPHEYTQVKSSVWRGTVINDDWLRGTRTEHGKSPLQHFHNTWLTITARGERFVLRLVSNKNFDHNDHLLKLIDNVTNQIPRAKLDGLGPRSAGAGQLAAWAEHLEISLPDTKDFLCAVEFVHGESETSWGSRAGALMRIAGFRGDNDAVVAAVSMVRNWVKTGRGPRSRRDLQAELTDLRLLERGGEVVLAIHGIDHTQLPYRPNAEIDLVGLYAGDSPFTRRRLKDPAAWDSVVLPALEAAQRELQGYASKNVFVVGAMRLSTHFAVGRTFPGVANWVLVAEFRGTTWSTGAPRENAAVELLHATDLGRGRDLAVAIALTHDPTAEVHAYIDSRLPVAKLITITAPGGPHDQSVPSPGWAADWVRKARELVRATAREEGAKRVHLFVAAPAGVAMFLGHDWNLMPTTTCYDQVLDEDYTPTFTFAG